MVCVHRMDSGARWAFVYTIWSLVRGGFCVHKPVRGRWFEVGFVYTNRGNMVRGVVFVSTNVVPVVPVGFSGDE